MTQREYPTRPLVGVGAVVFDEEGRVLLIQRGHDPGKGRWSLPGGLIELGETLIEGVKREVLEETGLIVHPEAVVEAVDRIYIEDETESGDQQPRIRYHYVVIDYWCRLVGGDLQPSSDAADVAWVGRAAWQDFYALDSMAVQVIEKGWLMAQETGLCSGKSNSGG